MMRFPPRLSWDLARVLVAQKLFGAQRRPLLLQLDLADFPVKSALPPDSSADSSSPVSSRDLQALARVRESTAPVVWIGGDTPLRYPHIGHLAREIVNLGRTVFVVTDGTLLRRRIHEFRPVARLYLALPLNGLEAPHDSRARQTGNFHATMESIRTAKLSGFHVCVETAIFADTDTEELRSLANFITALDVDGWIQKRPAVSAADQPSEEKLAAARKLIPNPSWRNFSDHLTHCRRFFEHLPLGAPHAEFACGEVGNVGSDSPNQELPTREESVRVP